MDVFYKLLYRIEALALISNSNAIKGYYEELLEASLDLNDSYYDDEYRENLLQKLVDIIDDSYVSKSTISAYENDKVDIKSSVIVELSNKLGTTPNYLLGFEKKNDFSDSIAALVSNVTEDKVRTLIFKQIRSILDCFTV